MKLHVELKFQLHHTKRKLYDSFVILQVSTW